MKKLLLGTFGLLLFGITGMSEAYTIVSEGFGVTYTASHEWIDRRFDPPVYHTADCAFDGDWTNDWNAGIFAYQGKPWIEVNLGQTREISRIVLGVEQDPTDSRRTKHQIWSSLFSIGEKTSSATNFSTIGSTIFDATLSYFLTGFTDDGQLLTIEFDTPIIAQHVQVRSIFSPSWIAWNEIQIMSADEVPTHAPEPATVFLFSAGLAGVFGMKFRKRHSAKKDQPTAQSAR